MVFILFRSTGEDDLDLMGRRRSRADDQVGDEELDGVDKEQEGQVDKEEVGEQLKTKKEEEEDKKEEEEDLEYLRLNCTRMGTRRATNFSQVWHTIYFYEYLYRALGFLDGAFYLSDVAVKEMLSKTKNKGKRQRHLCSTQHILECYQQIKNFLSPKVKGILHQKIFFRLNLIFWIVMGCGIVRFGRRGLKTTET